uniref:Uncharacterized protein n=1 Tax=Anguilla anguilla TaxID=7936 RepID=A0A0E9UAT4_ANGAN
MVNFFSSS